MVEATKPKNPEEKVKEVEETTEEEEKKSESSGGGYGWLLPVVAIGAVAYVGYKAAYGKQGEFIGILGGAASVLTDSSSNKAASQSSQRRPPAAVAEQKDNEEGAAAQQQQPYQLEEEVDIESLTCPITQTLVNEPATTIHGHLFELSAIREWVRRKGTCPLTQKPLREDQIYPQFALKDTIAEMRRMKQETEAS